MQIRLRLLHQCRLIYVFPPGYSLDSYDLHSSRLCYKPCCNPEGFYECEMRLQIWSDWRHDVSRLFMGRLLL